MTTSQTRTGAGEVAAVDGTDLGETSSSRNLLKGSDTR